MASGAGNLVRIGEASQPKQSGAGHLNSCQNFKPRPEAQEEQEDSPSSDR
jgi:hypothetical protein